MNNQPSNHTNQNDLMLPANYLEFVKRVEQILFARKEINLVELETIAREFGIAQKKQLKDFTEFAFVLAARSFADFNAKGIWQRYNDLIQLSKSQLNINRSFQEGKTRKEKTSIKKAKGESKSTEKLAAKGKFQQITNDKQVDTFITEFPTPLPIAYLMGQWCGHDDPKKLFNPVAGNGLLGIMPWYRKMVVSDPRLFQRQILNAEGFIRILNVNYATPLVNHHHQFDAVLVNPPYGKISRKETFKAYKTACLDKIVALNALETLTVKGRAAVLLSDHSAKFKKSPGKSDQEFLHYLISRYQVSDVIQIDTQKLFNISGIPAKLYLILIDGRRQEFLKKLKPDASREKPPVVNFDELWKRVFAPMIQTLPSLDGVRQNAPAGSKTTINYLDLFSGIGAFPKGLLDAGFSFREHYYSEIDKHAIANYKYNFKNATYVGSVQQIKTKKIQRPDLITFGSPCQNLSNAGKQEGIFGKRSKFFFDAIGIIDRLRPKVFVFENVKGLFFSNQGKDFEVVLREIAKLGVYECQWQLINSAWFLPQNRERIFLVGCLREVGSPQIFPLSSGYEESKIREAKIKVVGQKNNHQAGRIYSTDGFSPTLMSSGGYVNGFVKVGNRVRKLTPIECERLQGLPDNWTRFGNYEGEIKEISDHARYGLLGNAITSSVMKAIAKKLNPTALNGLPDSQMTLPEERAVLLMDQLKKFRYE
ncbi:MAG: DNA (cytosine-5-)-methyltransferase [Bacteroidetes bacterium]|nr:DNA (cytosine-5-)-methyltransferase [Bacteroidota bacterium]